MSDRAHPGWGIVRLRGVPTHRNCPNRKPFHVSTALFSLSLSLSLSTYCFPDGINCFFAASSVSFFFPARALLYLVSMRRASVHRHRHVNFTSERSTTSTAC
jgi:hypothetical protein